MIVRQLANSIVLSARSSALQKVTETVLAPLYMATVRQASQLASSASVVAERGGGGVHYPG